MTKEEFLESFKKSKFTFNPYHLEILYGLVKKYDKFKFEKAILKINEMDSFPRREKIFEMIESSEIEEEKEVFENIDNTVFENQWYIVNRAKNVWETSFLIKKSFWVKRKIESA